MLSLWRAQDQSLVGELRSCKPCGTAKKKKKKDHILLRILGKIQRLCSPSISHGPSQVCPVYCIFSHYCIIIIVISCTNAHSLGAAACPSLLPPKLRTQSLASTRSRATRQTKPRGLKATSGGCSWKGPGRELAGGKDRVWPVVDTSQPPPAGLAGAREGVMRWPRLSGPGCMSPSCLLVSRLVSPCLSTHQACVCLYSPARWRMLCLGRRTRRRRRKRRRRRPQPQLRFLKAPWCPSWQEPARFWEPQR